VSIQVLAGKLPGIDRLGHQFHDRVLDLPAIDQQSPEAGRPEVSEARSARERCDCPYFLFRGRERTVLFQTQGALHPQEAP
jgi:hypothetical protein